MLKLDEVQGYAFYSRSGGVVVLRGDDYIGFYSTLNEAFTEVLGD